MSSRIANGPTGVSDPIRDLIRSDPSVLESGFRILGFDFKTGPGRTLDLLGVDGSGTLVVAALDSGDPEAALARVLDGHLWAADQRDLLGRLYSGLGVAIDRPARGFLLAPSFPPAFLRRLSLLSVEVTPFLAREIEGRDGARVTLIERAARLFGLEADGQGAPGRGAPENRQPFWPEGVLPSVETEGRGGLPVVTDAARPSDETPPDRESAPEEAVPWPDAPEERYPWDLPDPGLESAEAGGDGPLPGPALATLPDQPPPAGAFEPLTTEELAEFERFERQRRERGGRSS